MYYAAMEQLAKINHHKKIVIGSDLPSESLAAYDKFMHEKVFPPKTRSSVKELVGDGHEKVQVRCSVQSKKKRARIETHAYSLVSLLNLPLRP